MAKSKRTPSTPTRRRRRRRKLTQEQATKEADHYLDQLQQLRLESEESETLNWPHRQHPIWDVQSTMISDFQILNKRDNSINSDSLGHGGRGGGQNNRDQKTNADIMRVFSGFLSSDPSTLTTGIMEGARLSMHLETQRKRIALHECTEMPEMNVDNQYRYQYQRSDDGKLLAVLPVLLVADVPIDPV